MARRTDALLRRDRAATAVPVKRVYANKTHFAATLNGMTSASINAPSIAQGVENWSVAMVYAAREKAVLHAQATAETAPVFAGMASVRIQRTAMRARQIAGHVHSTAAMGFVTLAKIASIANPTAVSATQAVTYRILLAATDAHAKRVFVKKIPSAAMDSGTIFAPPSAMRAEGIVRAPPQGVRNCRAQGVEDALARHVYANWTPSAATPVGTAFARVNALTPAVKTAVPQSRHFVAMAPVAQTKPAGHAPPIAEHVRKGVSGRFISFPEDPRFPSMATVLGHSLRD